MQITFYYNDIMPADLKAKIEAHTCDEVLADFPEDQSGRDCTSWGNYWIGDDTDNPELDEEHEDGYFDRAACIGALAFYDANVPEEKRHKWNLEGNGGWADREILSEEAYLSAFYRYSI